MPTAADARALAARRLPRLIFDFIDGGAGYETAIELNQADLMALRLLPRVLVDVQGEDLGIAQGCRASFHQFFTRTVILGHLLDPHEINGILTLVPPARKHFYRPPSHARFDDCRSGQRSWSGCGCLDPHQWS
jgi:hypothetical protein